MTGYRGATRYAAQGISLLMHPLLLPTYTFLFLSGLEYHGATAIARARIPLAVILFISTFLIPAILVMMMKTIGLVKSLHLESGRERTVPFLVTSIIYYLTYRYMRQYGIPAEFTLILLGSTAMILIAMLVNLRWKISIHMMGIGGVTGILHGLAPWFPARFLVPVMVVTGMAGLVGFSRLFSGSHRPAEVYAGFIAGYLLFFMLYGMALSAAPGFSQGW